MRIARKAIEVHNLDWLEEHFGDLNEDEQETLCYELADAGRWDIAEHICDDLSSKQLRIFAPGAVKSSQADWLSLYFEELSPDDQCMVCTLIAQCGHWDLLESIDPDVNPNATQMLLEKALQADDPSVITRILEIWPLENAPIESLCHYAAAHKNWELMRTLCEYADESALISMLDAANAEGNWEIIDLLTEYL